jgi:hypothetical protein
MNGLTMRASLFDRALMRLEAEATADLPHFTPCALARQYLMVERASCDAPDTEIANGLGARSTKLLEAVATAPSRDIGDVAIKLAVAIIEGNDDDGPIGSAHRSILGHALAELTILAAGPLPSAGVLMGMTEAELETQDVPMCCDGVRA